MRLIISVYEGLDARKKPISLWLQCGELWSQAHFLRSPAAQKKTKKKKMILARQTEPGPAHTHACSPTQTHVRGPARHAGARLGPTRGRARTGSTQFEAIMQRGVSQYFLGISQMVSHVSRAVHGPSEGVGPSDHRSNG